MTGRMSTSPYSGAGYRAAHELTRGEVGGGEGFPAVHRPRSARHPQNGASQLRDDWPWRYMIRAHGESLESAHVRGCSC